MIRLVALDLDGTLLNSRDGLSEANAHAVRRVLDRGVLVVLCTSRPFSLAAGTAEALGLHAPLICHNGALVRAPDAGSDLLHLRMDPQAARDVAAFMDGRSETSFVSVDGVTYLRSTREVDRSRLPAGMRLVPRLSDVLLAPPTAFLLFGKDAVDALEAAFADRYRGVLNVARGYSAAYPHYANVVDAGADKGAALRLVCRHLGVDLREALAVGDAGPDVSMFRVAGCSVAVANAPPEVQAEAQTVAPSNDEDGVAWALERFVLGEA
jgi:Cof subfamily protein (haloacid dehalogenase superfamily)